MTLPDTILVVDDDDAGRYIKVRILERAGYPVLQAASGNDALSIADRERPALLLLDVSLPDMSGIDVCRTLKAREPSILILQTSAAFTGKQDRAAGLAGGADSYLVEPMEAEELCATVEALLRLRHAEQELRESQATLERQIGERTHELADANEKLRSEVEQREQAENILRHAQRLDMLGQLTGSIAHDFNNLLAIILGNLDMLRRRLGANVDPKIAKNVENAFYGARRATSLTRQLLSFSRRQSLKPKPLTLGRLFIDLTGLLKQSIGEKVTVETDFSPDAWPIYVDQGELEAALLNLAMNARDAMPRGGVLTVAYKNLPAQPGHDGDFVAITVKDTGQGMSDKVKQYAFEPFFTTKQVGEGTGLGLAQVYGFSKQAGGDVRVDSEMGVGTSVTILLPRYIGPSDVVEKDAAGAVSASAHATAVLVVEDNTLVRAQTVDMLKELGHSVAEASSASDALDLLAERDDITLLLTDVGLPGGMDGTILAERAQVRKPTLQVLLTTGYAMTNPRLAQTRFPVLPKPYTFASLSGALEALQKPM